MVAATSSFWLLFLIAGFFVLYRKTVFKKRVKLKINQKYLLTSVRECGIMIVNQTRQEGEKNDRR
jgi:hypothetical protein